MSEFDSDLVRQLANILGETGLTEIEYDTGSIRIRVVKSEPQGAVMAMPQVTSVAPAAAAAPAATAPAAPAAEPASNPDAVKAPMVGVAYLSPEPGAATYVSEGSTVKQGDTLLLIEAMKTFNPVKAPKAGTVKSILISDGSPVEFDQPLFVIE